MVDLVLINGKVWTGDAARPWAESVAVRGGTIFAVGTAAELAGLAASAGSASTSAGRSSCPASSTATPISWPAASR